VDHQVGDRARRQHRVVAARTELDPARLPAQPLGDLGHQRRHVDGVQRPCAGARPGRPRAAGALAVQLHQRRGLHVTQPDAGAGGQVGAAHHLLGVPEVLVPGRAGGVERRTQLVGEVPEVGRRHRGGRFAEGILGHATGQGCGVLRRGGQPGGRLGVGDQPGDVVRPHPGAADDTRTRPVVDGDDRDVVRAGEAVGGEGVGGPAQVGGAGDVDQDDARAGCGGDGTLGELGGCAAHDEPSAVVLITRTPVNRALGQPWLTAATWPGWPLPQLKAPPSTQVDGPPTRAIEPQKSVVVAW